MKIALVNVCDQIDCLPIGYLCLHAWVKQHRPEYQVDIIESKLCNALGEIIEGNYDYVGLSAMSAYFEKAKIFARKVKELIPQIKVIIGGCHISVLPETFEKCFDIAVLNEGEETLVEILDGKDLTEIKGILFRTVKDSIVRTMDRKPLNLENFPPLDYSIIHPHYFRSRVINVLGDFGIEGYLMTSRGCPFKCTFCASSHFWQEVRYFSIDWIMNEITNLIEKGCKFIHIVDDLFACNKRRLKEISINLYQRNLIKDITYDCSGTTGSFDEDICRILVGMNIKAIFFGFENGNQRILTYLKKGKTTVEDNKSVILICAKYNIKSWGSLIIGIANETIKEVEDTIEFIHWAKKNGVDRISVYPLIPYPGTPIWDEALSKGLVNIDMNFNLFNSDSMFCQDGIMVPLHKKREFYRLKAKCYKAIHSFKWRKAWKLFKNHPIKSFKFMLSSSWYIKKRLFSSKIA
jgi:radical SAM superfamily enzyme YgiQ (UPF0313 family)